MSPRKRATRASSQATDPRSRISMQRSASVWVTATSIDLIGPLRLASSTAWGASGAAPLERTWARR
eukprot:12740669-Alexandrium_andersonii.AAC.1